MQVRLDGLRGDAVALGQSRARGQLRLPAVRVSVSGRRLQVGRTPRERHDAPRLGPQVHHNPPRYAHDSRSGFLSIAPVLSGEDIVFLATDINLPGAVDWVMMQSCFGHHFMLILEKQEKYEGHPQFFAVVQIIGSRKQAENFAYRFVLFTRPLKKQPKNLSFAPD